MPGYTFFICTEMAPTLRIVSIGIAVPLIEKWFPCHHNEMLSTKARATK